MASPTRASFSTKSDPIESLTRVVPAAWLKLASEASSRRDGAFRLLLSSGRVPKEGWSEDMIEEMLNRLSRLDSNNFSGNVGAGEREGRVFSSLVRRRHFGMAHGMGRSGDVGAAQPKAVGSSSLARLTDSMVLHLMRESCGLTRAARFGLTLPCATGMALQLCLTAVRDRILAANPEHPQPLKALWTRVDQKTCLKAILAAGFVPIVVENLVEGDAVKCDLGALEALARGSGAVAICSTTSCFAPRVPDDVSRIAEICAELNLYHVVNNAYGLSCNKCCSVVEEGCGRARRVDAVVQSTDKNFMVPVGGSVVCSPKKEMIESVSKAYPGRASVAPVMDLFITLLAMGQAGYERLRRDRTELARGAFRAAVEECARSHGLRLLLSPRNTISFAVSLPEREDVTMFGSMLFTRGVSGARVVARAAKPERVGGVAFPAGYGASARDYPCNYFTVACALGLTAEDLEVLKRRLNETLEAFLKSSPS